MADNNKKKVSLSQLPGYDRDSHAFFAKFDSANKAANARLPESENTPTRERTVQTHTDQENHGAGSARKGVQTPNKVVPAQHVEERATQSASPSKATSASNLITHSQEPSIGRKSPPGNGNGKTEEVKKFIMTRSATREANVPFGTELRPNISGYKEHLQEQRDQANDPENATKIGMNLIKKRNEQDIVNHNNDERVPKHQRVVKSKQDSTGISKGT